MLLKSILNRVQVHHGFVYETARWAGRRGRSVIEGSSAEFVGRFQQMEV